MYDIRRVVRGSVDLRKKWQVDSPIRLCFRCIVVRFELLFLSHAEAAINSQHSSSQNECAGIKTMQIVAGATRKRS